MQHEDADIARRPVTCAEAGARGGRAVVQQYGTEHLREAGRRGGQATARRYPGMARKWGKMGGRPRKRTLQEMERGHPSAKGVGTHQAARVPLQPSYSTGKVSTKRRGKGQMNAAWR